MVTKGTDRRTLYIIRHGVTAWNEQGKVVGHHDLQLSDQGREQATGARAILSASHLDFALASPLKRTRETAEIVLRDRDLVAEVEPRFIELALEGWEGRARSDLRSDDTWNRWIAEPHRYPTSGGEMLDDVRRRAASALTEAVKRLEGGGALAIFTHGGVARLLMLHLLGMPTSAYHKVRCDCASVSVIEVSPEAELACVRALNVTAPLRALPGHPVE